MPNHTVVAVYETAAQAAAAVNDLQTAHVLPDAISQHTKTLTASGTTHSPPHEQGFWASLSAKKSELEVYLEIASIKHLVDVATSSEDAEQSKPAPDIFRVALEGFEAVAIGDTPYDAEAAGKAGIPTIGMLCGGFTEAALREGGCVAVYPGPGALLACFDASPMAPSRATPQET